MLEYLETKNLSDKELPGSRPGKSTVTAGVAVTELKQNIVDSNDKGEKVVNIFFDLSCAFDSVFYSILVQKLKF